MNYILQLPPDQLTSWKSRIKQYALDGKNFSIQQADNGLIVQPLGTDEEDFALDAILASDKVETDEEGVIYYEQENRVGLHFTTPISADEFISNFKTIDE
jgi:hypothetical protein